MQTRAESIASGRMRWLLVAAAAGIGLLLWRVHLASVLVAFALALLAGVAKSGTA